MADVNAEYFQVKLNLFKHCQPKVCKKKNQYELEEKTDKSVRRVHCLASLGIRLLMPKCDPRDRFVYPIHKLMIDFYKVASCIL